jgi:PAS domain S-box-containing protein
VGIAMSDFETGKIIEFNEAMIQPGGYTAAELKGMTYSDLIPQEMHPDWLNAGLRLHEHGRFGPVEVEFLRKDGSRYPVMMNGFLLKSSSSKTVVWSIVEDITERKAVELKLRAAIDAAETANAAKSAFLAMMSHEIRTPLNGIIGSADLLERSGLSEEQKELTHTIQSSGESLLTVINDVLDYSKIEAGRLDVESIPVSPIGLLTDVVNLLRPSATNKALALRTHIEPTVPETIYGDPTRIKQILINLIGNAIKFTQCGSVSIQVSNPGPDSLRFEVTDTGLGIENSRIETLFEAFTQADSSTTRKYGGTGLGLAISKKLVQLMSGSIGVESVLGHGSTFWIEFPLGRTAAGELPAPSQGEGGALKIDRSIRILIAEDNPINQQLAARLLRSLALTNIRFANNGKQALEMAQSEHFDLILMDSQMPEMDGHDATREIRLREGDGRQVRIIGLSALAMQSDRWKAIDAGMDDYLTKPVRREDLARMLKEWFPKTDTPGSASPPPLS